MEVLSPFHNHTCVACVITAFDLVLTRAGKMVLCALQAEFLRDALYRFLPSATLDRVNRVIKRLQAGKFEGTLGRSTGHTASSR